MRSNHFHYLFSFLLSLAAAPYPTFAVPVANITKRGPTWGFPYGSEKVRGVNLGGWLVLEPFITPSLFDATGDDRIVDEYTFGQYQDYNTAHAALVNHWDTWITYQDFVNIKNAGLNHIRLPIGYWAWDVSHGEPYHQGQLTYLTNAINWARQIGGLKILVDLHGAPGSQNGFDNSGQRLSYPGWQSDPTNVQRTSAIIKTLANWYSSQTDVVVGIAPLNEPAGFYGDNVMNVVRQYWYDSYGNIRYPYGTSQEGPLIEVIHDAFQPLSYWNGFAAYPGFEGVMMDTHYYGIFSQDEVSRSWDQQVSAACARGSEIAAYTTLWTIVGEWTTAATDCARYLNGRGVGSRYDGSYPGSTYVGDCSQFTGSGNNFSSDYKAFLRRFWEAQVTSWEQGGVGWIFWTWKTESADEWSYSAGLQYGWIP